MRRWPSLFALFGISLLVAGGAAAQTAAPATPAAELESPSSPVLAEARSAFQEGIALAKVERWTEALGSLQRSATLRPHAVTSYNIGFCELKLGRLTRARRQLAMALDQHQAGGSVELSEDLAVAARAYLGETDQRLARVVVTTAPGAIAVDGAPLEPAGGMTAAVLLAGTREAGPPEVPPAPTFEVWLDPGIHRFSLTLQGGAQVTTQVNLAPRSRSELSLFPPPPTAAKPSPAPLRPAAVPAPRPSRTPAFVAFGTGAVGLTVGTVSGLIAFGKKDDVRDACSSNDAVLCTRERNSGYRAADISTAAFIVGGAALGTGAFLLLVWPGSGTREVTGGSARVHALVRGTSLSVEGRF